MWALWFMLILALALLGGALCLFVWARKEGQFQDVEGIKYRMLEDPKDQTGK